ncbi:cytochrome c family protein [Methylocella sp. CPCC 101449]|jgi:cytochrome c|uniref:c-type cytochrome n=1 Tax=Methylocella sp. CPCC 101449 TaxID=2987531 RepID=UPI000968E964|nr:c-type cytochrome [Methylocella sp. CPCC 101449]MBN9084730.1 c-type cytochrome [Hyphomicrobiales bacterium]MDT2019294.1 c-type cytochrome [Methylocella sp. CPCC 101449]OJY00932.1 MAG: cytochrome c family protein [Rhizobiales bacterium 62-17]HEV2573307.1 c-type cytochrome [Beijerinckiaceae bacterium]
MDSFELNKIAGAVLGTLLFLMGLGIVSNAIYHAPAPKTAGYDLPADEPAAPAGGAPAAAQLPAIADLLAKADPVKGEQVAKAQCGVCHSFEKGGPVKQGPSLYGIVHRPMAAAPGFAYSNAILDKAKAEGKWSFEDLNHFIFNPRGFANGTKMTFGGLKSDTQRADLIDYLHTLTDSPVDLPKPGEK